MKRIALPLIGAAILSTLVGCGQESCSKELCVPPPIISCDSPKASMSVTAEASDPGTAYSVTIYQDGQLAGAEVREITSAKKSNTEKVMALNSARVVIVTGSAVIVKEFDRGKDCT